VVLTLACYASEGGNFLRGFESLSLRQKAKSPIFKKSGFFIVTLRFIQEKSRLSSVHVAHHLVLVNPIIFKDLFDIVLGCLERWDPLIMHDVSASGIVCRKSQFHVPVKLGNQLFEIPYPTAYVLFWG
jgi:hypothetical protein